MFIPSSVRDLKKPEYEVPKENEGSVMADIGADVILESVLPLVDPTGTLELLDHVSKFEESMSPSQTDVNKTTTIANSTTTNIEEKPKKKKRKRKISSAARKKSAAVMEA